jgi:hypothetical protein
MRGGKTKIKIRRALLYDALRRLGLDTDPAARKPKDQQIVLLNRETITGLMTRGATVSPEGRSERSPTGTKKQKTEGHS